MKPVFVDRTGQRRRLVRVAGAAAGLLLALASLLLVAGFTGAGPGHLPLLPQPAGGAPTAPRSPAATRPAPAPARATVPAPADRPSTVPPPTATARVTPTPTPSRTNHRRVPTHTPGNNRPSKPS
ncbi:hypothetical protein ACTMTJ_19060 [Phytohabitans sp. LJ34]|uniref:hypothetical protein n=1 Tax=Phytohabitans sp. LJ34 TaxID=3452217 RepID=UPI003F8AE161